MIYEIGTISTKANDPKITGKNTLWKNSVTKVSVGQIILIQSGNTIYQNSIRSVESDTQMTLSFPVPVALTDVKYVISITMIGSVSDGVNKATAMVTESYQLMMILNRLMTESGVIKVVLPDGTEMQLRTEKERDRLLDGKFDKTGGFVDGSVISSALGVTRKTTNSTVYLYPAPDSQPNGYAYFQYKIGTDWFGRIEIPRPANNQTTQLMQVGDLGFGAGRKSNATDTVTIKNFNDADRTAVYKSDDLTENARFTYSPMLNMTRRGGADGTGFCSQIQVDSFTGVLSSRGGTSGGRFSGWMDAYSPANTTKDSNGNLKAASPIIRVFADHVDPNEEAEGVTLKKLHTGIYQLHGVLGLHSDASWGGINGGITIPCGINQLPLIFVKYDVLEKGTPHPFDLHIVEPDEDGDIVLYTSYRPHELPQDIQYERFKLYPEFLRDAGEDEEPLPLFDGKVELTPGALCDIPRGHWIDVRVNMPSNSIYNQKQAEAERLAKLEAERLAQEEAKRAVEEAERAEQEAVERKSPTENNNIE